MSWFLRLNAVILSLASVLSAGSEIADRPVRRRANSEMKIALTFDDGPSERYTEEILEILDEYGIKATFFVIGKCCDENPDLLKMVYDCGHEIGNHTYSHRHPSAKDPAVIRDEIKRTEDSVKAITGESPVLFRPPEGAYTDSVVKIASELGCKTVLWSVDTLDWRRPSAEKIVDRVMKDTASGSIILCHDNVVGESNTPAALRMFIPRLLEQGYVFVTVSELLAL